MSNFAKYEVKVNLNKAVRRNIARFPHDFMFQLNESEPLKFQIGISKTEGRGGRRTLPFAFTQEGIAMLSSILRSEQVFVQLRELLLTLKILTQSIHILSGHQSNVLRIILVLKSFVYVSEGGL